MKKYLLFFVISFVAFTNVFSQQEGYDPRPRPKNCETKNICPRNSIFLESNVRIKTLFGLESINWDHTLVCRSRFLISYIFGADFYSFKKTKFAGVPFSLNIMIGGGALMAELGVGINYLYAYKNYNSDTKLYVDKQSYFGLTGFAGVRYEMQKSFFARAGFTPLYSLSNYKNIPILASKKFNTMFGVGIGYTF